MAEEEDNNNVEKPVVPIVPKDPRSAMKELFTQGSGKKFNDHYNALNQNPAEYKAVLLLLLECGVEISTGAKARILAAWYAACLYLTSDAAEYRPSALPNTSSNWRIFCCHGVPRW